MKHINKNKIMLICLIIMLPGCKSYQITDADKIIYSRKDLWSSGKVELTGVTSDKDLLMIKDFKAYHTNMFFTLDVSAENVIIEKEELKKIVEK